MIDVQHIPHQAIAAMAEHSVLGQFAGPMVDEVKRLLAFLHSTTACTKP